MSKGIQDLVNSADFKELKYAMVLYNVTSKTELLQPQLFKILKLDLDEFAFRAPAVTAGENQRVSLFVFPANLRVTKYNETNLAAKDEVINIKGQITDKSILENTDNKIAQFNIKLEAVVEAEKWKGIVEMFSKKQEDVNRLFGGGEE